MARVMVIGSGTCDGTAVAVGGAGGACPGRGVVFPLLGISPAALRAACCSARARAVLCVWVWDANGTRKRNQHQGRDLRG